MKNYHQNNTNRPIQRATRGTPFRDEVALLTVDEACSQLRISRWTLYRLIHRRAIRTIKIGNRRLVPPTAIQDLIRGLEDRDARS